MKALVQLLFPTLKAFIGVLMFMFTVVSVSYVGIVSIAKSEAQAIEGKMMAVGQAHLQHVDKRINRLEVHLDERFGKIEQLIKEQR